jgi:hypothetical protein
VVTRNVDARHKAGHDDRSELISLIGFSVRLWEARASWRLEG